MSLIPSESESFPDSFRTKVGWHVAEQPDDPKAVAAVQRMVAALPPSPAAPTPSTPKDRIELPPEPNPPAPKPPTDHSVPREETVAAPVAGAGQGTPEDRVEASSQAQAAPPDVPTTEEETQAPVSETPAPPEPLLPEAASLPKADDTPRELLPTAATNDSSPPQPAPESSDMSALVTHFLSTGVPISIEQPNGGTAPPVPSPAPQRSGFVIRTDNLPLIESTPSTMTPNESRRQSHPGPEATPAAKPASPVSATEIRPTQDPVSEQPSDPATASAAGSGSIGTPAQASQILQFIAAAVQRQELTGEAIADSTAVAPAKSVAAGPEMATKAPGTNLLTRASSPRGEQAPANRQSTSLKSLPRGVPPSVGRLIEHSESAEPSLGTAKPAPAKIRITPRRIKPRPQPEPTTPPEVASEVASDSPNNGATPPFESPNVPVKPPNVPVKPPKPFVPAAKLPSPPAEAEPPKVEANQRRQPIERREPPTTRQLAAVRREMVESDVLIFSARERRNRWIGFGLSEVAALIALVLLGRFGFTHHFPDPTLKVLVFILLFAAAAVAIALPIAFLRNDPARWGRQD